MDKEILNVSEIFYSLQGEGARAGTPTFFIRLQGCKAKMACYASGIRCDTEFESGSEWTLDKIISWLVKENKDCKEITWTGGEPLDQLTEEIISYFKEKGYYQAVETSGLHPAPKGFDFICISPKVAEHVIKKNFDYKILFCFGLLLNTVLLQLLFYHFYSCKHILMLLEMFHFLSRLIIDSYIKKF